MLRKRQILEEIRRSIFRGLFGVVLFLCVGANIFDRAKRRRGKIVGNNRASLN